MNKLLLSLHGLPSNHVARNPDVVLAALVALVIGMMIIPMPSSLLDVFLATNITLSALILVAVILSDRALALSSFPSLLLLTTLFRLALNVSTTRLVLSRGSAGEVVRAFGEFVLSGDIVVGLVIFLIITLVQFLVIAKGAERVAEVGARFTLDAMPGNQMSIDAALRAGTINDEQAQEKRDELSRESQFYGAMDGAMKFVKGDAVAGLVITGINLVGGLAIGVLRFGLSASQAAQTYSTLTVGDGLVSQIPALLITLAAGILTTRVVSKEKRTTLGGNLKLELFANAKVLGIAAAFALALAVIPGLPTVPFALLAFGLGTLAVLRSKNIWVPSESSNGDEDHRETSMKRSIATHVRAAEKQKAITDSMAPAVAPVGIDLDPALSAALGIEDDGHETELLGSVVPQIRDALYLDCGVRFPGVRLRSSVVGLAENSFVIRIKDVPVYQESLDPTKWVACESPERLRRLGVESTACRNPLTGAAAAAVPASAAEALKAAGVRVWSPLNVIGLCLARVLRQNAKTFVGLQETSELVERLERVYPALVKEVVPKIVSLTQLNDVLRRLVDENISIRDLKSIFEALADHGPNQTDNVALTECVRACLSIQIGHSFAGTSNRLSVILLDHLIEDTIRSSITPTTGGASYLALEPELRKAFIKSIARTLDPVIAQGIRPVILTTADVRRFVRKLIEEDLAETAVLSFEELPSQMVIQPLGRAVVREIEAAA